jgi:hypothetical protein
LTVDNGVVCHQAVQVSASAAPSAARPWPAPSPTTDPGTVEDVSKVLALGDTGQTVLFQTAGRRGEFVGKPFPSIGPGTLTVMILCRGWGPMKVGIGGTVFDENCTAHDRASYNEIITPYGQKAVKLLVQADQRNEWAVTVAWSPKTDPPLQQ